MEFQNINLVLTLIPVMSNFHMVDKKGMQALHMVPFSSPIYKLLRNHQRSHHKFDNDCNTDIIVHSKLSVRNSFVNCTIKKFDILEH